MLIPVNIVGEGPVQIEFEGLPTPMDSFTHNGRRYFVVSNTMVRDGDGMVGTVIAKPVPPAPNAPVSPLRSR